MQVVHLISRSQRWLFGLALSMTVLLTACGDANPKFYGADISGANIGENWSLIDQDGQPVSQNSFPGKVGLVFFGFTQCPDVCPAALSKVNQVLSTLGDSAEDVQVLMISVDPERDTPEILDAYLEAFDQDLPTRFLGLRGSLEQTRQAVESYRGYFAKSPTTDGGYNVDHSASFYLVDKTGKARVLINSQTDSKALTEDIKTLLKQ